MEQSVSKTVENVLDGMHVRYDNRGKYYETVIKCKDARLRLVISCNEKDEEVRIYGLFPVFVPESRLDDMYKFVNDMNRESGVGSFSIDPDRELVYRLTEGVGGADNREYMVWKCIISVLKRLMSSFGRIMDAMFGGPQMVFTFGEKEEPDDQEETD